MAAAEAGGGGVGGLPTVVIDNGGGTVKVGWATDASPVVVDNAKAKTRSAKGKVLIGAQIEETRNKVTSPTTCGNFMLQKTQRCTDISQSIPFHSRSRNTFTGSSLSTFTTSIVPLRRHSRTRVRALIIASVECRTHLATRCAVPGVRKAWVLRGAVVPCVSVNIRTPLLDLFCWEQSRHLCTATHLTPSDSCRVGRALVMIAGWPVV